MWPHGIVNYFVPSTSTVDKDMRDLVSDFNSACVQASPAEGDGPQSLLVTQRVYSVCVHRVCTRVCTGEPGGGRRPAVAAGHPASGGV